MIDCGDCVQYAINSPDLSETLSHFDTGRVQRWQDASGDPIELKKVNCVIILMHMELQLLKGSHLEGLDCIRKPASYEPDFLPPSPDQALPTVPSSRGNLL